MVCLVLYKKRGVVCSKRSCPQLLAKGGDPQKLILDGFIHGDLSVGLSPVGRLDKESEGLIVLTTMGKVSRVLTFPGANVEKKYQVLARSFVKNVSPEIFSSFNGEQFRSGFNVKGIHLIDVSVEQTSNLPLFLLHITLTEGKKREIRRVLKEFSSGFRVLQLIRTNIGLLPDITIYDVPKTVEEALVKLESDRCSEKDNLVYTETRGRFLKPNEYRVLTEQEIETILQHG